MRKCECEVLSFFSSLSDMVAVEGDKCEHGTLYDRLYLDSERPDKEQLMTCSDRSTPMT